MNDLLQCSSKLLGQASDTYFNLCNVTATRAHFGVPSKQNPPFFNRGLTICSIPPFEARDVTEHGVKPSNNMLMAMK